MISEFKNDERWLSNFAPVRIELDGRVFFSVEHAYMSAKSDEYDWKDFCANPNTSASHVKRASRDIQLIHDWDNIKLYVMEECVRKKFNQEPYRTKLLNTGDIHIQEGNYWNDKFWGVCLKTNRGENHLGRLIMQVRDELKNTLE